MARVTRTNFGVVGLIGLPSRESYGGLDDTLVLFGRVVLQEYVFDSPETPSCERSDFVRGVS